MERSELMAIALAGEDSHHQFKRTVGNSDALAAEMVAFLNSDGGTIFVGVEDKTGDIVPLNSLEVARINQLVSNAASNNVKPAFDPFVENVVVDSGVVMCIKIPKGIAKPYITNDGGIWVKVGSDKRRVTAKEELLRMFQETGSLHGDEMPVPGTSIDDFDIGYFKTVFERLTGMSYDVQEISTVKLLENMNLMRDGYITVAGMVLFGKRNIRFKYSRATIKAVQFAGHRIEESSYVSRQEFSGKLVDVYQELISFCISHIKRIQGNSSFNSDGELEIPRIVFEEIITNALVHRDFLVSDTVKLFIFDDRIEVVSPGHLPNSLTVDNILMGNSCTRNSVIVSYATRLLQFSGLGSGIRRALNAYPAITFDDDRDGNRFVVTIKR